MGSYRKLLDAICFAAMKHRDQSRKDKEASPYINHPIAVAHILAAEAGVEDLDLLVAALLHDTVEDTQTTFDELEGSFGGTIRELVAEVTDDKGLPKAERKRLQIQAASEASAQAQMLKIADKIANIRDIVTIPPEGWSLERKQGYLDWAEQVVAGCRGCNAKLEAAFDRTLEEARDSLGRSRNGG